MTAIRHVKAFNREVPVFADRGPDRGPAVHLREDPTRLTPIDVTTEEVLLGDEALTNTCGCTTIECL